MKRRKTVVAGSRNFNDYTKMKTVLDRFFSDVGRQAEITVLSGGCRGADRFGERYAEERGYRIERVEADWNRYGKKAGPLRNEEMARRCDDVICFWDGSGAGTKSMIAAANKYGKPVFIIPIEPTDPNRPSER